MVVFVDTDRSQGVGVEEFEEARRRIVARADRMARVVESPDVQTAVSVERCQL